MPQKSADDFHSAILPFLNFIPPLESIIWNKYYLIALAQGHFQSDFLIPSHIQEQTLPTETKMQKSMSWYLCQILSQLLGISALAAVLSLRHSQHHITPPPDPRICSKQNSVYTNALKHLSKKHNYITIAS